MYLAPQEAIALIEAVLTEKNRESRMRASERVISVMSRIAFDPAMRWDDFVATYLEDCLALGQPEKALVFLNEPRFTGNQQKRLLETAVSIYLALGKTKPALEWIELVRYAFGPKSIESLVKKPAFAALRKSKKFLAIVGPKADLHFFDQDLAEAVRMWKRKEYDNVKDALETARDLDMRAAKLAKTRQAAATKHLNQVVAAIEKAAAADPSLKKYLKGLLPRKSQ